MIESPLSVVKEHGKAQQYFEAQNLLLTAAQVSALPDRIITDHWPTVTSPVSAVSNTTGPVTLTTLVSGTTAVAGHIGGEWIVYLNYTILSGNPTSDA